MLWQIMLQNNTNRMVGLLNVMGKRKHRQYLLFFSLFFFIFCTVFLDYESFAHKQLTNTLRAEDEKKLERGGGSV